MHGEEKKKKSTARFGGHCIGFLIPTVIVGLRGWNKSGCGQRTGEVEQVNSFTSAPISRALGFFPPGDRASQGLAGSVPYPTPLQRLSLQTTIAHTFSGGNATLISRKSSGKTTQS